MNNGHEPGERPMSIAQRGGGVSAVGGLLRLGREAPGGRSAAAGQAARSSGQAGAEGQRRGDRPRGAGARWATRP
ncbi:MAG: hypothetical protein MI924_35730 [Chloroflexales bacterium]|nr:hypothetical protein [Chloroflexales bacterium]